MLRRARKVATGLPAGRWEGMRYEWFEKPDGGVLELSPEITANGLALELEVFELGEMRLAWWMLEDGTPLAISTWGEA